MPDEPADPAVQQAPREVVAKKKKNPYLLPLGLVGGGLAAATIAKLMLSGKERNALQDFGALGRAPEIVNKDPLRAAHETLTRYAEAGSQAANAKPFGLDTGGLVRVFRSLPGVPEGWKWEPDSGLHYDAFKRGPLDGYARYMDESAQYMADQGRTYYNNELRAQLAHRLNDAVRKVTKQKDYFPADGGIHQGDALPIDMQRKVLSEFSGHVGHGGFLGIGGGKDRELGRVLEDTTQSTQGASKTYGNSLINPILGSQDALFYGGVGAAGTGSLMALWHKLHEKKHPKKQVKQASKAVQLVMDKIIPESEQIIQRLSKAVARRRIIERVTPPIPKVVPPAPGPQVTPDEMEAILGPLKKMLAKTGSTENMEKRALHAGYAMLAGRLPSC